MKPFVLFFLATIPWLPTQALGDITLVQNGKPPAAIIVTDHFEKV